MAYADTSGTQADYDRYYTNFAAYETPDGTGSGVKEDDARRLEESVNWLAARIGAKDARIIDIGCAQGGLLKALARRGFSSLSGIDPSACCVEQIKTLGFSAWQGHFDNLPSESEKYDFIISTQVLEHVLDTHGAFCALRKLLAPGGKIYVEVPNAARYHNGKDTLPFQEINQEHINHFDITHMEILCASHGFTVTDVYKNQYNVLGVLLTCGGGTSSSCCQKDKTRLKQILSTYILESQQRMYEFSEKIRGKSVALWGAGARTQWLLAAPVWNETKIEAIVDRDPRKQGKRLAGCVIQSPEAGLRHLPDDTLIVITPLLYAEEIKNDLAGLKTGYPSFVWIDEVRIGKP
ncbi:MAG: methyltransferase domain-containing protein [Zoogloeaceae bacterium]|nr:methyltransferase domain-containing protein [Zoogloeaceae bacterium]